MKVKLYNKWQHKQKSSTLIIFYFVKDFIYLFSARGEGREGERHQFVASRSPPTGDLAHNPGKCPDRESNWRHFSSQAWAQPTEPHQPGLKYFFFLMSRFTLFISFFKFIYLFIFREGKGGREEEKHQCVVASSMSPTRDLGRNPGVCPDWESKQWPFGLQASTQSTEPHQPGFLFTFFFSPRSHTSLTKHTVFLKPSQVKAVSLLHKSHY